MRIELNGTDMNGSVDSRRKSKGKREGEGFLGEENLEAKVVKVGKEGNLLWMSVGKQEPWHLAVVYIAPRKTDEFLRVIGVARRCRKRGKQGSGVRGLNSRIGEIPNVMIDGEDDDRIECTRQSQDTKTDWRGKYLMTE